MPYVVPYVTVEKTTVYLPAALKKRLRATARQRNVAEAALIREAIENVVAPRPHYPLFDSGDPTFASRVDEMLAEGFGLDSLPPEMRKRYEKRGSVGARSARR